MRGAEYYGLKILLDSPTEGIYDLHPERYNTDPGSEFASDAFTGMFKESGIMLSTDGLARVGGATRTPDKISANNEPIGAFSRLLMVMERYPDLKSNQNFLNKNMMNVLNITCHC
jgi:hypothetical protein